MEPKPRYRGQICTHRYISFLYCPFQVQDGSNGLRLDQPIDQARSSLNVRSQTPLREWRHEGYLLEDRNDRHVDLHPNPRKFFVSKGDSLLSELWSRKPHRR